jgi:cytochrome oxidase Cu insertion factor (SCO1/SenC/PrrC family)
MKHRVMKHGITSRLAALAAAAALTSLVGCAAGTGGQHAAGNSRQLMRAANANPDLDPGSSLGNVPAPDFRLTNQFGQQISLSAFRGKEVILAFTDSECTTVCPLTTMSLLAAKELLGKAGSHVQLLAVDANPKATAVSDVLAYSRAHGMVNQWDFLTGSLPQLEAVWRAYHIYVQIVKGQVDHTPAVFIIDARGLEQKVYLTTMAYASIGQAAQLMATEVSSLLPSHPSLVSERSLGYIGGISPTTAITLPILAVPGRAATSVSLGPGKPHLVMFFATWLDETSDLKARLLALNSYVSAAKKHGLPGLVAVDEAVTEPSASTARDFLQRLGQPLRYPVAADQTGRLADGYGVQDQPWFVLTSAAGKIVWKHDGWLSVAALKAAARHT